MGDADSCDDCPWDGSAGFICFRTPLFWEKAAFLALFPVAFLAPLSLYAIYSRGHMLMGILALMATFSLFRYLTDATRPIPYLALFTLASVSASFAVPLYAYQFTALVIFGWMHAWVGKNRQQTQDLLIASLLTGAGLLICYLPVLTFGGWQVLLANKWVIPTDKRLFYNHILPIGSAELVDYLLGVTRRGYIGALGLGTRMTAFFIKAKLASYAGQWCALFLTVVVVTLGFITVHGVFPPYRSMIYLIPYVFTTGAILLI